MGKIKFYSLGKPNIKNKKIYETFFQTIIKNEEKVLKGISFIFCSDRFLLSLNSKYLNHNFFTDILTFPVSDDKFIESYIYISTDRVKENAKTYNVLYQNELLRVMIHGVLHLCGYNDKFKKEIAVMRRTEDFYIQVFYSDFT